MQLLQNQIFPPAGLPRCLPKRLKGNGLSKTLLLLISQWIYFKGSNSTVLSCVYLSLYFIQFSPAFIPSVFYDSGVDLCDKSNIPWLNNEK